MDFSHKQIVFVTGKGGVGKSTIAAAIALKEAEKGRKVLLVELGETSFYSEFFGIQLVSHVPMELKNNLNIVRWSMESCLKEYVLYYLKIEKLYQLFFENKIMQIFTGIAPSLSELAILGKITSGVRRFGPPLNYDLIVVDSYATGHFLALLRAPKGMGELARFGPMREHSHNINQVILNPLISAYVLVTLAEALPVTEAQELDQALRMEFQIQSHLVCNRLLQISFEKDLSLLENEIQNANLKNFVKYLSFIQSKENQYLNQLKRINSQFQKVPLIIPQSDRWDFLRTLGQHLSNESKEIE